MSGSGGFYKYRCKYFYSHNCPNWVWVNNAPCATCLAEGRDEDHAVLPSWSISRDIAVPKVRDGVLQYTMMELVAPADAGNAWTIRDKNKQPPPALPVTSSMPSTSGILAGRYERPRTIGEPF